ncbi:hypothetical protein CAPTEDRAFT_229026 [Capitella teleta]|uniref:Phytanoyl-CoA hydroxylase-interacting protein-like C-terminal domain-containing protein n=1 Tax=Capitella teleta TaxID=283909 RepID=R7VDM4_CAPTE|nr:hypothetical protein CAPTEDRAFT_229026 [Capitella teleta]|eukprot:ELU14416.1 hypothetical protein CAPTEDRAFT_229026 [Capitella teleta]
MAEENKNNRRYAPVEMEELAYKAWKLAEGIDVPQNQVEWFYRDVSRDKEKDMRVTGRMQTYLKDNNGDPRCPINGNLKGLHFAANVDYITRKPKVPSPYGNRRLKVPALDLIKKCPNLYFADMFCYNTPHHPHHILLVMTRPGSPADRFCSRCLPRLNWYSNPFLVLHSPKSDDDEYRIGIPKHNIWVELFYTEHVDSQSGEIWEEVPLTRRHWETGRQRRSFALTKRARCRECNFP